MGANVDVVRSAWEGVRSHDLDVVTANMDNEAETRLPRSLPWGGTYWVLTASRNVGQFMSQLEDFRPILWPFLKQARTTCWSQPMCKGRPTRARTREPRPMAVPASGRQDRWGRAGRFADTASTLEAVR
jgi:hypothetical protein